LAYYHARYGVATFVHALNAQYTHTFNLISRLNHACGRLLAVVDLEQGAHGIANGDSSQPLIGCALCIA
jgi:hypothetical protein